MAKPLVTLSEYKAYLGINNTDTDSKYTALIAKVSELVKTICRRTFVDYIDDFKTEISNGGFDCIIIKETPILAIASVGYSTDYGQNYTDLEEFVDFALDIQRGVLVPLVSSEFTYTINGYQIVYNAGFDPLPEDLKLAIFDLIKYYASNDAAVHSPKAPGSNTVQIEYILTTNLPANIKRILDQYTESYD